MVKFDKAKKKKRKKMYKMRKSNEQVVESDRITDGRI